MYFKEYLQQAQDLVENESILLQTLGKGYIQALVSILQLLSPMLTAEEMLAGGQIFWLLVIVISFLALQHIVSCLCHVDVRYYTHGDPCDCTCSLHSNIKLELVSCNNE